MSIPFGASTPASGFNFFNGRKYSHHSGGNNGTTNPNKHNDLTKINERKSTSGFKNSQKFMKKPFPNNRSKHQEKGKHTRSREDHKLKPKLKSINSVDDTKIGSLLPNPHAMGFRRISHRQRPIPRFLINQQPHLKTKKFVQDPWDAANQQKMLQLESSIEDFSELYETLKKMRDVERKMMENKQLVDKADSAKDLTEAIDFQGTCQDMCPIFERARRNVEYTVYSYEKKNPEDKKAARDKALKVFARPAAAAAPPLPSDVRPPHILAQSLDYIVENLLTTLPDSEGFIWDRMRSIRQDFTYQNYCGPEAINCNERIVRIHLLIIHVMAKRGMQYSLQQELEQLHKSLITLSEIYDEVRSAGGSCPNEAEFRAYALLSKIRDPEYDKNLEKLPVEIFQNEIVQQAVCFRRIVSNSSYVERGVIRTENCLNFYKRFFQLIKTERIPFLMSSFLELYVNEVRFYAFKALSYSINKKHKAIPTEYFMADLAFNNEEELVEFCKYYSIEVNSDGVELKTLAHNSHRIPEKKPLKQAYLECVDIMLQGSTFSSIINSGRPNVDTIPEKNNKKLMEEETMDSEDMEQDVYRETNQSLKPEVQEIEEDKDRRENFLTDNNGTIKAPNLLASSAPFSLQQNLIDKKTNYHNNDQTLSIAGQEMEKSITPLSLFDKESSAIPLPQPVAGTEEAKPSIPATDVKQGTQFPISSNLKIDDPHLIENKEKQKKEKEKNKKIIASEIGAKIIEDVVHRKTVSFIEKQLQKNRGRNAQIEELSSILYRAFIHEKLYLIFLNSKAENYCNKSLQKKTIRKWLGRFRNQLHQREIEKRKKEEIQRVSRQLGVPVYNRRKTLSGTPCSDETSFSFSSARKGITFSPVNNEVNKFDVHKDKRSNIWDPLPLKEIYFDKISTNIFTPEEPITIDLFIYGKSWDSICGNWMISKFGLSNREDSYRLSNEKMNMHVRCIDDYYDPGQFTNLQLLVFNTGVTDSNIFDLELKLQQDGEELIKLITGICLNTNICFNLLLVYWESAETPLDGETVSKCLKLNRISKSFSGALEHIGTININSHMPHKILENGLTSIASQYRIKLTDRGRYDRNLRGNRTVPENSQFLTTKSIDEKMKRMHESEKKKLQKLQNDKNTYLHLQSHIAASPKLKKRKLPVLLSKTRDNRYETPETKRTASSSSSAMLSHLAIKLRNGTRFSNYNLPPATPSHSTNLPISLMDSHQTPPPAQSSHPYSHLQNVGDQGRVVHEPALFQTPISSTITTNSNPHDASVVSEISSTPNAVDSSEDSREVPSNLQELKNLIESVKTKVNAHQYS